ncbi:MAG: GNAT family N-acetyltransferase [Eubacterium sp.]|nr:GNAT family N-acetyltransferase [Eubacterium sp.]
MMKMRFAKEEDFCLIEKIDDSIVFPEFKKWADNKQVYLIFENDEFAGWLQFGFFLEKIPMINYLALFEQFRGIGTGTLSLLIWERQMMEKMYDKFIVAPEKDNETAIKFFEEKGYKKIGDINIPDNEERLVYFKHKPLF